MRGPIAHPCCVQFPTYQLDVVSGRVLPLDAPPQCPVPVPRDPGATCPRWEGVLQEWLGEDVAGRASRIILQEFFGACLLPGLNAYRQALLLVRPSRSGRPPLIDVLRSLVGAQNIATLAPSAMDNARRIVDLERCVVNVSETLSGVVGGLEFKNMLCAPFEARLVDPKYEVPRMVPIACRFVFESDRDWDEEILRAGLLRRFNVIHIRDRGTQSSQLKAVFQREMQGVLNWALHGAERLARRSICHE